MSKGLGELLDEMRGHEGAWDRGSMQLRSYQCMFNLEFSTAEASSQSRLYIMGASSNQMKPCI